MRGEAAKREVRCALCRSTLLGRGSQLARLAAKHMERAHKGREAEWGLRSGGEPWVPEELRTWAFTTQTGRTGQVCAA